MPNEGGNVTAGRLREAIREIFPRARWCEPGGAYGVLKHSLRRRTQERAEDPWPRSQSERMLFIDLETLGFIGRPLFLIGILEPRGRRGVRLVQLLARDYTEEAAILRAFRRAAREARVWITFNGKAFDAPFLLERFRYHRLDPPRPERHLDLLHAARRIWRGILPDCRLKTLETRVCGLWRGEDLEGGRIPDAYHEFVRTGSPQQMIRILDHNRRDLLVLARLFRHLMSDGGGLPRR